MGSCSDSFFLAATYFLVNQIYCSKYSKRNTSTNIFVNQSGNLSGYS